MDALATGVERGDRDEECMRFFDGADYRMMRAGISQSSSFFSSRSHLVLR